MSFTSQLVIFSTILATVSAVTLSLIALAKQEWRHVLVLIGNTPVLNGTEGLWRYCENDSECINLDANYTGKYYFTD